MLPHPHGFAHSFLREDGKHKRAGIWELFPPQRYSWDNSSVSILHHHTDGTSRTILQHFPMGVISYKSFHDLRSVDSFARLDLSRHAQTLLCVGARILTFRLQWPLRNSTNIDQYLEYSKTLREQDLPKLDRRLDRRLSNTTLLKPRPGSSLARKTEFVCQPWSGSRIC
jgi:hypothetical protein